MATPEELKLNLKKAKQELREAREELNEAMPYPQQPNELSNTMQVIKQVVDSQSYQKY